MPLKSLWPGANVAVIGASGGLGGAFVDRLAGDDAIGQVFALSRRAPGASVPNVTWLPIDMEAEDSIAAAAGAVGAACGQVDLVIVAAGILHDANGLRPEKSWRALDMAALERVFRINTFGPALVAKHFLPLLPRDRKAVFAALSARVGSIGDNQLGGWYAYRASKAALNMMIKTLSIELARRNPDAVCVGLHPGTVDTALSAPFQGGVPREKLFAPEHAATCLLRVIDGLGADDTGHVYAWDGQRLPF